MAKNIVDAATPEINSAGVGQSKGGLVGAKYICDVRAAKLRRSKSGVERSVVLPLPSRRLEL